MIFLPYVSAALLAANVLAFIAFWQDKRRAQAGARRISEATLLSLAALGGTAGAISAQHLFRHKTRKEPFRTTLYLIAFLQVAGISLWLLVPGGMTGTLVRLFS